MKNYEKYNLMHLAYDTNGTVNIIGDNGQIVKKFNTRKEAYEWAEADESAPCLTEQDKKLIELLLNSAPIRINAFIVHKFSSFNKIDLLHDGAVLPWRVKTSYFANLEDGKEYLVESQN